MKTSDFAYASAVLRSRETAFLPDTFFEQVLQAENADSLRRILTDKGFLLFENALDPDTALKDLLFDLYNDLKSFVPDVSVLDFLIVKNDFHNLKAALKCVLSGREERDLYRAPSKFDPEPFYALLSKKDFEALPEMLRESAKVAYEVLITTRDSALAELLLDQAALREELILAKTAGTFAERLAETECDNALVKIALRLARQKPEKAKLDAAFVQTALFDPAVLKTAVVSGEAAVKELLARTDYRDAADLPFAQMEKALDDKLVELCRKTHYDVMGPEVVIAFYKAKEIEITNLRLTVCGALYGSDRADARQKRRALYV